MFIWIIAVTVTAYVVLSVSSTKLLSYGDEDNSVKANLIQIALALVILVTSVISTPVLILERLLYNKYGK